MKIIVNQGEKLMAYFFLALIFIFAFISFFYVQKNSFSRETIDILFPAIGAILFSVYLGVKTVWLDAPAPKKFGTTIAVLHDSRNGKISGLYPLVLKHLPLSLYEFRGAQLIDTLPLYNDFKSLDLPVALRDTSGQPIIHAPIQRLIEYSILEWLSYTDMRIGSSVSRTTEIMGTQGGSVTFSSYLIPVTASLGDEETNPFLKARPISLNLPPGSNIIRTKEHPIDMQIVTKHSKIRIRSSGGPWGVLETPFGKVQKRMYEDLGISGKPEGLGMHGFNIEFEASQVRYKRFSKQAKIEAKWIERLESQIEKDFSWSRIQSLYTDP